MKGVLATFALAGAVLCSSSAVAPATAAPFPNLSAILDGNELTTPVRWVCNRHHQCVWRGYTQNQFYYGPRGWKHCDYRWRTGRNGPYRERICF